MFAVAVGPGPTFGKPQAVFEGDYALDPGRAAALPNYDVSRDGRQFVMIEGARSAAPVEMTLVLNWFLELN